MFLRYRAESISIFFVWISNILRYRTGSISNISTFRYRYFRDLEHSISNYKHSISSFISYLDIEGHLVTLNIECFNFNIVIPISKVRRSISNVAKVSDEYSMKNMQ